MNISATDRRLLLQPSKIIYDKIEVLNRDFQVINTIQGQFISGNINIDNSSDLRRTCSVKFHIADKAFNFSPNSLFWFDKYIKIYKGIYDFHFKKIQWYNLGIFSISSPSIIYNNSNNEISFTGNDLTAELTGLKRGKITGGTITIPEGISIRESIIQTVTQLGGFKNYIVDNIDKTVPYTLEFGIGSTVWDILVKLRDLYPNYEMFFDIDGIFIFRQKPSSKNEPVIIDYELTDKIITSDGITQNINTDNVKNYIEVYGATLESDRYAETSTYTNNIYNITLDKYDDFANSTQHIILSGDSITKEFNLEISNLALNIMVKVDNIPYYSAEDITIDNLANPNCYQIDFDNAKIIFKDAPKLNSIIDVVICPFKLIVSFLCTANNLDNPKLNINSYGELPICDIDGNQIKANTMIQDNIYYFIYQEDIVSGIATNKRYLFLGKQQITAMSQKNDDSALSINKIGIIPEVLSGGEYENYTSVSSAQLIANHELYSKCRITDSITISVIPVYWLDVNKLIELKFNKDNISIEGRYIINSLSIPLDLKGTMSISAERYYPYYESGV